KSWRYFVEAELGFKGESRVHIRHQTANREIQSNGQTENNALAVNTEQKLLGNARGKIIEEVQEPTEQKNEGNKTAVNFRPALEATFGECVLDRFFVFLRT